MGFKEYAKKDLEAIFNVNEFAEIKKINEIPMTVIFEEPMESTTEREGKYASPSASKYSLFIPYNDEIWNKYRVKNIIKVENQNYIIEKKSKEFGLIKFQLERNKDF